MDEECPENNVNMSEGLRNWASLLDVFHFRKERKEDIAVFVRVFGTSGVRVTILERLSGVKFRSDERRLSELVALISMKNTAIARKSLGRQRHRCREVTGHLRARKLPCTCSMLVHTSTTQSCQFVLCNILYTPIHTQVHSFSYNLANPVISLGAW